MYSNSTGEKYQFCSLERSPPPPLSFPLLSSGSQNGSAPSPLVARKPSKFFTLSAVSFEAEKSQRFLFKAPDQTCDRQIATNCALLRKRGTIGPTFRIYEERVGFKTYIQTYMPLLYLLYTNYTNTRCYLISIRGSFYHFWIDLTSKILKSHTQTSNFRLGSSSYILIQLHKFVIGYISENHPCVYNILNNTRIVSSFVNNNLHKYTQYYLLNNFNRIHVT